MYVRHLLFGVSIIVIVDSQIIWIRQGTTPVRFGGAAQRPRPGVRTVSIAPYPTGQDTPFCGIDDAMFKPCATIGYAMSNIDSLGQWVTYVYAPGNYTLSDAITISYAGVTIKSRDGIGSVTFTCGTTGQCLSIQASSTRIMGLIFGDSVNAISVLSGMCGHHVLPHRTTRL
jgi:hypothetical protein